MFGISARIMALPGETIAGRYRVQRVLGQGGMGVVLLARHLQLEHDVAIKILRTDTTDAPHLSRFLREARFAARLKGEHVARVFDFGEIESVPYLVMEYLEGSTLAATLAEDGPFSITRAVDSVLQVCEALAEAHAQGIVHRDVKLANLFVARAADGRFTLKLLDFGVAKMIGTEALTRTSAIVGSPAYMAPEQLDHARDVDARADLWSVGVVLFELITGEQPFRGDTLPQLCVSVREQPHPQLRKLRRDAPATLEHIVDRCLAKTPSERYASVAELAQDLAPLASTRAAGTITAIARLAGGTTAADETADAPSARGGGKKAHTLRATFARWRALAWLGFAAAGVTGAVVTVQWGVSTSTGTATTASASSMDRSKEDSEFPPPATSALKRPNGLEPGRAPTAPSPSLAASTQVDPPLFRPPRSQTVRPRALSSSTIVSTAASSTLIPGVPDDR